MPARLILVMCRVLRCVGFIHGAYRLRSKHGPVEVDEVVRAQRGLGISQFDAETFFVELLELRYVIVLYHKDTVSRKVCRK